MKFARLQYSLVAAVSFAALTLTSAPFAIHAAAPRAGTIQLGFFGPLTGDIAIAGEDMLNAEKLAVADWNKKGGVLGQQISVDAQDSPCNPQIAVQAAQKIVSNSDIAVVGPYCSSDAIPASVIYNRAGIPFMVPASTNPRLTLQGFHNIFRTIGRDDEQGQFAASVIIKWHALKVAIVHDNSTYGKGVATLTRASLAKMSPSTQIVYFDAITRGAHDFTPTLTKIRDLHPDLTYFTGYFPEGGLFVKQFVSLGVSGRIMCDDANNDPTFIKLAGAAAEKAYITGAPVPQMVPSAASFVKAYTATYHIQPGAYSAYTYDATNVLLTTIQQAKTTKGATLISMLAMVKDFPGVTGPITFTATGDRKQIQYVLATVRKGQFVAATM